MTEQQRQFLSAITPAALESERRWQIPASITIAQAILESGWGQSQLFKEQHNPFGIKFAHHSRSAPQRYGEYLTAEYAENAEKPHIEKANFALYQNLPEAFEAHARLIWNGPYSKVIAELHGDPATRPQRLAHALQECHYSTDPHYAAKLMQVINQFHLADIHPQITQIAQIENTKETKI